MAGLDALKQYKQFIICRFTPSPNRPGKVDKVPCSIIGNPANAHESFNWTSFNVAEALSDALNEMQRDAHVRFGVGFVLTDDDPFFCLDIDNCRSPTGDWNDLAGDLTESFSGAAVEISQSGGGLHIFGSYSAPLAHSSRAEGLELYTSKRFIALTGNMLPGREGDAGKDCTQSLKRLIGTRFSASPPRLPQAPQTGPSPDWRGPVDDEDLIRRALRSASAASSFGARASFAALWFADASALAVWYPDAGDRAYDASAADAALAAHLAFWTGNDAARIERLMRNSSLARDKYSRADYLARTISATRSARVCQDKPAVLPAANPSQAGDSHGGEVIEEPLFTDRTGNIYLSPEDQKKLFAGCVYVHAQNRVLVPGPSRMLMDRNQFRAKFGGYVFALDATNQKTTRSAWEAFTESMTFAKPEADDVCFRPDLPPAHFVRAEGINRVNTYWPAEIRAVEGDAEPFVEHLRKLLPDDRDRQILTSYLAACVQRPGVKYAWMPVLQGTQGNGKTTIATCLQRAIGAQYTHWLKADDLHSEFNGWLEDKMFVAIEELKGADMSFASVSESLKTIVAGGDVQIQKKYANQASRRICANFFATTNYKSAIKKTKDNSRRFAVFFTAQQSLADRQRDGMCPASGYFQRLRHWLDKEDGFAIITQYLRDYKIEYEFDPAGALSDAPNTSTTAEAIEESRGGAEQALAEMIEQQSPGFANGWVSSMALDKFFVDRLKIGGRVGTKRRREMLEEMGYVRHPGLSRNGRPDNPVAPDFGQPILFVKPEHYTFGWAKHAEIAKAYTTDQSCMPSPD